MAISKSEEEKKEDAEAEANASSVNADKLAELEEKRTDLEGKLKEEENQALEIKFPTPVKEKDKLNVIIFGPEKCGKSTLANYLA